MQDLVKVVDIVKEYTKDVHVDYDRETILLFLNEKFLQDFLVRIDRTPYMVLFKLPIDGKLICIVIGYDDLLSNIMDVDDNDED